jgi:hypothetical protein
MASLDMLNPGYFLCNHLVLCNILQSKIIPQAANDDFVVGEIHGTLEHDPCQIQYSGYYGDCMWL